MENRFQVETVVETPGKGIENSRFYGDEGDLHEENTSKQNFGNSGFKLPSLMLKEGCLVEPDQTTISSVIKLGDNQLTVNSIRDLHGYSNEAYACDDMSGNKSVRASKKMKRLYMSLRGKPRIKEPAEKQERKTPRQRRKSHIKNDSDKLILKITVLILGLLVICGMGTVTYFYTTLEIHARIQDAVISSRLKTVVVESESSGLKFSVEFGIGLPSDTLPSNCWWYGMGKHSACLNYADVAQVFFHHKRYGVNETSIDCYDIQWRHYSMDDSFSDCIDLSGSNWFGGTDSTSQMWPLNNFVSNSSEFITGDQKFDPKLSFGSVIERLFLTSDGKSLLIKPSDGLSLKFYKEKLCLNGISELPSSSSDYSYQLCHAHTVDVLYKHLFSTKFVVTEEPPDYVFRLPAWSFTYSQSEVFNFEVLESLLGNISTSKIGCGSFYLDNLSLTNPAYVDYDETLSTNLKKYLSKAGDSCTAIYMLTTSMFGIETPSFKFAHEQGYLVYDPISKSQTVVKSRLGFSGMLDASNPNATSWYLEMLNRASSEFNSHCWFFDDGQANYLTSPQSTYTSLRGDKSNFTAFYNDIATALRCGKRAFSTVTSAFQGQSKPLIIKTKGSSASWRGIDGLSHVLPKLLSLSLIGYSFVIPPVIGGWDWDESVDKELYSRWMALSTFLPIMHFSKPPWSFGDELQEAAKKLMLLHASEVFPEVKQAILDRKDTGLPILRPLWLKFSSDTVTHNIHDQYMIGSKMMVAPILKEGQIERDVYIPKGTWTHMLNDDVIEGPKWILAKANMVQVPYFILDNA